MVSWEADTRPTVPGNQRSSSSGGIQGAPLRNYARRYLTSLCQLPEGQPPPPPPAQAAPPMAGGEYPRVGGTWTGKAAFSSTLRLSQSMK